MRGLFVIVIPLKVSSDPFKVEIKKPQPRYFDTFLISNGVNSYLQCNFREFRIISLCMFGLMHQRCFFFREPLLVNFK